MMPKAHALASSAGRTGGYISLVRASGDGIARAYSYVQAQLASCIIPGFSLYVAVIGEGRKAITIDLIAGRTVEIGRGRQHGYILSRNRCELRNQYISARHALLGVDEHGAFLVDVGNTRTGSKNGTYLNDFKLTPNERVSLNAGDRISLGHPGLLGSEPILIQQRSQSIG